MPAINVQTEFETQTVLVNSQLPLHLICPAKEQLAAQPLLLLSFAMDWQTSLCTEPYNLTATHFLRQGHRVASFDLPNHGQRVNEYGRGIAGFRNALTAGENPFTLFIANAKNAIDYCIDQHLAEPQRIMICGTSRAGYLALRLLAEDGHIAACAAFAPVTDWRCLDEFAADKNRQDIKDLKLSRYTKNLSGKSIFIAIGNHDDRVGTASCCRFYLDLLEANKGNDENINFQIHDSPGHYSQDEWYISGAKFLINTLEAR